MTLEREKYEGDLLGQYEKKNKSSFIPATRHAELSTGEVIRMLRQLKNWTQEELASRCGINATNICLLEKNRVEIGKHRAESIAKAFGVHPAIMMFPEYEAQAITLAA